ncbi:MAG TPA: hypothetical protein VFU76_02395 [Terriglobales bacterium]|nr:hypothetical protein [Terriglobales bacterium]
MIHSLVTRVRHSSSHPLLVSLCAAVIAVSDPARSSSLLLGMLDSERLFSRTIGRFWRRAA